MPSRAHSAAHRSRSPPASARAIRHARRRSARFRGRKGSPGVSVVRAGSVHVGCMVCAYRAHRQHPPAPRPSCLQYRSKQRDPRRRCWWMPSRPNVELSGAAVRQGTKGVGRARGARASRGGARWRTDQCGHVQPRSDEKRKPPRGERAKALREQRRRDFAGSRGVGRRGHKWQ